MTILRFLSVDQAVQLSTLESRHKPLLGLDGSTVYGPTAKSVNAVLGSDLSEDAITEMTIYKDGTILLGARYPLSDLDRYNRIDRLGFNVLAKQNGSGVDSVPSDGQTEIYRLDLCQLKQHDYDLGCNVETVLSDLNCLEYQAIVTVDHSQKIATVTLSTEDKAIDDEWEQTKQNQQEIVNVLLCKSKNLGLDLSDHEVQSVDIDHDDSFYMLTYRLTAIMHHCDGSVYPIKTNLEIATGDLDRSNMFDFEITASWFSAHIEVIDNAKRVVCDRHDGRIIFDLDIA